MLRQFNRFLVVLVLVAIVLIFTLKNSDLATLRFSENFQLTTYAGILYLGMFALGCVAASVVALFFGFKGYLRERRLVSAERSRQAFFDLFVKARSYMAGHEWSRARDVWEQVLKRDPDNVVARVELSACLEALGDVHEALRVLDSTRASSRANWEVLFRAAALNRRLGNNTAASDNLVMIVQSGSSKKALEMARDLSEEMGRIDDAVEYQSELDKLGYDLEESTKIRTRLTFAQLLKGSPDSTTLKQSLESFLKRNPGFTPALEQLADLEIAQGRFDEGADLLVKSAKASRGDITKWAKVIQLWLDGVENVPTKRVEKAISAARVAIQETRGTDRLKAEVTLAKTLLAANKAEQAREVLDLLPSVAQREGVVITDEILKDVLLLKGLSLSRLGLTKETNEVWEQLAGTVSRSGTLGKRPLQEPSPALSTP